MLGVVGTTTISNSVNTKSFAGLSDHGLQAGYQGFLVDPFADAWKDVGQFQNKVAAAGDAREVGCFHVAGSHQCGHGCSAVHALFYSNRPLPKPEQCCLFIYLMRFLAEQQIDLD